MLWWQRAALAVISGDTLRAGLITTNSIIQKQNRSVVEDMMALGANVIWTIPDHPWVDDVYAAAVRVAMTVIATGDVGARRITVDGAGNVISTVTTHRLNSDLSAGIDLMRAVAEPLLASRDIATVGFKLYGDGFILDRAEADRLRAIDAAYGEVIRPFLMVETSRPARVMCS